MYCVHQCKIQTLRQASTRKVYRCCWSAIQLKAWPQVEKQATEWNEICLGRAHREALPLATSSRYFNQFIPKIKRTRCLNGCLPFFQCCGLELRTGRFQQCTKAPGHRWHGWAQYRLLTSQRKLNTNFSLVAKFLTRKLKGHFMTSKTLQPNERYLPISCLRLLKHQTRSPATYLVATQLQDRFMKTNSISKILHFNSAVIANFLAWLLKQCISKGGKKRPGSSLAVAVEYVCRSSSLMQGGKRIGSLAATTTQ